MAFPHLKVKSHGISRVGGNLAVFTWHGTNAGPHTFTFFINRVRWKFWKSTCPNRKSTCPYFVSLCPTPPHNMILTKNANFKGKLGVWSTTYQSILRAMTPSHSQNCSYPQCSNVSSQDWLVMMGIWKLLNLVVLCLRWQVVTEKPAFCR